MAVLDVPLMTTVYGSPGQFLPDRDSLYVYRESVEHRSGHLQFWRANAKGVHFAEVTIEDKASIAVRINSEAPCEMALRSEAVLVRFWECWKHHRVYLDFTGMRHHVWAALLRTALLTRTSITAVYVEPGDYRRSLSPTEGSIYDLSERIEGLSPLPGFARLREAGADTCFVPLLGFEGTRFAYLLEQVQPPGGKVIPIIGVPGFRPEYPFASYLGNRRPLMKSKAWREVRFVPANCPFSLFAQLEEIASRFREHLLKIAPIGTKPHALGAVLFATQRPRDVELVYDHPVRKAERTVRTSRLLAYELWRTY